MRHKKKVKELNYKICSDTCTHAQSLFNILFGKTNSNCYDLHGRRITGVDLESIQCQMTCEVIFSVLFSSLIS